MLQEVTTAVIFAKGAGSPGAGEKKNSKRNEKQF